MFISNYASRARIASGTSILLGIWLLVSPWVFGYQVDGAPAIWNSVTVGGAVAFFAACNLLSAHPRTGLYWINVLLALWIMMSPFRYGYAANTGFFDNLVLAVMIAGCAIGGDAATASAEKVRKSEV
jgi:hypothetical protein